MVTIMFGRICYTIIVQMNKQAEYKTDLCLGGIYSYHLDQLSIYNNLTQCEYCGVALHDTMCVLVVQVTS